MSDRSFKVFAFDGLHGGLGQPASDAGPDIHWGNIARLAGGSVVRLIPEAAEAETPPWASRLVMNCMSSQGATRLPLLVNRTILAKTVISVPVTLVTPAQAGGRSVIVRTDEDTTVGLREPVTLDPVFNTTHTGNLFGGGYPSDIDINTLDAPCRLTQLLGMDVQIALPAGSLLEVVEAAPGSTDFLQPGETPPPPPTPGDELPAPRSSVPKWVPILIGVGLLGLASWLMLGGGGKKR